MIEKPDRTPTQKTEQDKKKNLCLTVCHVVSQHPSNKYRFTDHQDNRKIKHFVLFMALTKIIKNKKPSLLSIKRLLLDMPTLFHIFVNRVFRVPTLITTNYVLS
jgi:hypothetical protein